MFWLEKKINFIIFWLKHSVEVYLPKELRDVDRQLLPVGTTQQIQLFLIQSHRQNFSNESLALFLEVLQEKSLLDLLGEKKLENKMQLEKMIFKRGIQSSAAMCRAME